MLCEATGIQTIVLLSDPLSVSLLLQESPWAGKESISGQQLNFRPLDKAGYPASGETQS